MQLSRQKEKGAVDAEDSRKKPKFHVYCVFIRDKPCELRRLTRYGTNNFSD